MGGKSKIANRLARVIGGGGVLYEPFIGGGAMTAALAPHFDHVYASDNHLDLILMWDDLKMGWEPPRAVSQQEYENLRHAPSSALRGFVGYGCSWGGKWFGGYAKTEGRNYADESSRALLRDIEKMGNVAFGDLDYRRIRPIPGSVVYADPPYKGTTDYRGLDFDSSVFWAVMRSWVDECSATVYVSEYQAPRGWDEVWSVERTRDMRSDLKTAERVTERLYKKDPRERSSDFTGGLTERA